MVTIMVVIRRPRGVLDPEGSLLSLLTSLKSLNFIDLPSPGEVVIERSSITLPYPPPGAADPRSYHPLEKADGGHPLVFLVFYKVF